jgi:hypothetical protein
LVALEGGDPFVVGFHLVEDRCFHLHLKEENCLVHLILVKVLEPPDINESLNDFVISIGVPMVEVSWHTPLHDFEDTFHKEEVAIFELILSLIMSVSAEPVEVRRLRLVRPVSCSPEQLFSEGNTLVVRIYPLVE